MQLEKFFSESGMKKSKFAESIGVSRGRITQLLKGSKPSKSLALLIEIKTNGYVKAKDLLSHER